MREILAAGGYTTVNTLGGGFDNPFGVAVDASGNVYVADDNNSLVKKFCPAQHCHCVNTLGSGFKVPDWCCGGRASTSMSPMTATSRWWNWITLTHPSLAFLTATPVGTIDTTAGDSPQT